MSDDVIALGGVRRSPVAEDPFEVAFRPAKPALDAALRLREPLARLDKYRRDGLSPLDPDRAAELCKHLPDEKSLIGSFYLFEEAEQNAAPEGWVHVVIGLMLDSTPQSEGISDAYACSIVDGMYHDEEVWGDYAPGFSHAVIVRAIREARRMDDLPFAGRFLAMCARHREHFMRLKVDTDKLIHVRDYAEEILGATRLAQLPYDDADDVPF
jgi:hypothetical protein